MHIIKSPRGHETHSTPSLLASVIKEERKSIGMTQKELSDKLKICLATIRKI